MPSMFFNTFSIGTNWLNLYQPETNYGVEDTFSKTKGSHSMSFGGTFKKYSLVARNTCAPDGYFNFNGNETHADVSDYYIGAPSGFVQCSVQLLDNRTWYLGPSPRIPGRQPPASHQLRRALGCSAALERCLWPSDHACSGRAVRQVPQLTSGQRRSGRSGSSEHDFSHPVE